MKTKFLIKLTNIMINIVFSFMEVLVVIVPVLLSVAFITIIERKTIAAIQRRVGPNAVGIYGTLQPLKIKIF